MKPAIRSLSLVPLAYLFLGMAEKPPQITVRFYAEAMKQDSETFSRPIMLKFPPREGYIEKVPVISEREFRAIYPFRAADGTWGCAFKLDEKGRMDLEMVSSSRRGTVLVAFVATKAGMNEAAELAIDAPVKDGIISIPSGITELEMAELKKYYPVIGETKKKK